MQPQPRADDRTLDPPASEAWRPSRPAERPPQRDSYVYNPDLRILETLCRRASWSGRTWCQISAQRLLELVLIFTKRNISRRSLYDHLGGLIRAGYIRRQNMHRRSPYSGELELHPTLYVMTNRAWSWAKGLGVNVKKRFTATRKPLPDIAVQTSALSTVPGSSFTPYRAAHAPPRT